MIFFFFFKIEKNLQLVRVRLMLSGVEGSRLVSRFA